MGSQLSFPALGSFTHKGQVNSLLGDVPVYIVINPSDQGLFTATAGVSITTCWLSAIKPTIL